MDAIDRAIAAKWHLSDNFQLNEQTWEEYERAIRGRKVLLFGTGNGAEYFFYKYKENAIVDQIIDNDKKLQGYDAKEIIGEMDCIDKQIKISDISILERYNADKAVILITSLRYYAEIAKQLEGRGYNRYYALLPMEANQRRKEKDEEREDRKEYYVRESCKQKINSHKIVCYTMGGYSGHGKYIVKQLKKIRKDLDVVWFVNDLSLKVPEGIRLVYYKNKKRYIHEIETAKLWIFDSTVSTYVRKRPEQIYVQVKHWSSITLKTFGLDYSSFRGETSKIVAYQHDSEMIDYIITGSKFDEMSCRRAFDFSGEVFEAGSPRTDILFHSDGILKRICRQYHLAAGKKLLLYAPTFRLARKTSSNKKMSYVNLCYEVIKEALEHKFGGEWVVLVRLHPNDVMENYNVEKSDYVIDVSDYSDSQELVAISDVMITDYSSIMFEPAFVNKPVFLYATDKKDYINRERELLIKYDTLPFPIAECNEELVENIRNFDRKSYEKRVEKFMAQYGIHEDGHASERAAQFISQLIDE